jgi:hypothetical protein
VAKKFKFCIHCRRLILESEIARQEYVTTRYGLICRSCADRLGESPEAEPTAPPEKAAAPPAAPAPPAGPALPPGALEKISAQLEQIQRTLLFEKSSAWNVLGALTQCLAVGMLLLAVVNWHDQPMNLLLIALLFQSMALTFFVKAK